MRQCFVCLAVLAVCLTLIPKSLRGQKQQELKPEFHTSDRCVACHNELSTDSGKDVSIGTQWRATIMANSARDPYFQASVRRETIDHPESAREIEHECSTCHFPITHYEARLANTKSAIFAYLPFVEHHKDSQKAADGVTCSICHQISSKKLGTRDSFNGNFVVEPPASKNTRHEYGPFNVAAAQQRIMDSSTGGYLPTQAAHIEESAMCGSCHQLYTITRAKGGKPIGILAEQTPYLEFLHSDSRDKYTCQSCHMPLVTEPSPAASVLGPLRIGRRQHLFLGGNFFVLQMLNRYRADLAVAALPQELAFVADRTLEFLHSEAARVEIRSVQVASGQLQADVFVQNLTGHKLPTAFPSRRAWLHFVVHDRDGRTVFESGALNRDGSIQGNDNDADATRFEPHYREITRAEQVQIYEDIMKDANGHVTTGLISGLGYIKDNRILPSGFNKATAISDIAVAGDAADDPAFVGGGHRIHYRIPLGAAQGPFRITVELYYQPIGFRWAHNFEPYKQTEPERFLSYFKSMSDVSGTVLARAEQTK